VVARSVVNSEAELREVVREMASRYGQPALVEEFIGGREFTVGLLGERRPRVLAPMEIVFTDKTDKAPIYKFEDKLEANDRIRYEAPAKLDPGQMERLKTAARGAFMALGCRDVARIDFRMDDKGRFCFIECNPLPGLTPGWSDLVLIAQGEGVDYRTLIGEIMAGAVRRYKEREATRRNSRDDQRRPDESPPQGTSPSSSGPSAPGNGERLEAKA
jgi:D-alanine-D-alanine ligase